MDDLLLRVTLREGHKLSGGHYWPRSIVQGIAGTYLAQRHETFLNGVVAPFVGTCKGNISLSVEPTQHSIWIPSQPMKTPAPLELDLVLVIRMLIHTKT